MRRTDCGPSTAPDTVEGAGPSGPVNRAHYDLRDRPLSADIDIRTRRLDLIAGTAAILRAELASREAFVAAIEADVPASWPPELYDADATRWSLDWIEKHPDEPGWNLYYIALRDAGVPTGRALVGVGGYTGAAVDGVVEVGYGVVPEHRRRGYAVEAVLAWVERAFRDPRINIVAAHTLPELAPSIGVLEKTRFTFVGPGRDAHEPTAIRYELTRAEYERGRSS